MRVHHCLISGISLCLLGGACVEGQYDEAAGREEVGRTAQALTTGPGCVEIRRGVAGDVWDTDISESYGGWAAGAYPGGTKTGGTGDASSLHYAAFKFDLSVVPTDAHVTTSTFRVHASWNTAPSTVRAHMMTVSWDEATATFASLGGSTAYSAAVLGTFDPAWGRDGFRTLDVSALTKAWLNGTAPNHGIVLEEDLGTSHHYSVSEASTIARRPSLTVCWDGPIDVDHCAGAPCQNGGACIDGDTDYTCECEGGWTGANCDACPGGFAADGTTCLPVPSCPLRMIDYRDQEGTEVTCDCASSATSSGTVWGTDTYTDDSQVCRAAVHAGKIPPTGGIVTMTVEPGRPSYVGSSRNGVTTAPWGSWPGSFSFR
jgi:LCCL domain/EGF-like domain